MAWGVTSYPPKAHGLTPRNYTSKAPTTSTTLEREKHVMLPIAPLPLRPGTPGLPSPTSGRARGLRPCRRCVEMWFWSAPGPFRYNLDFTPIHRGNKKGPACVRCWNILGKGGNSSNAPIVCLKCGKGSMSPTSIGWNSPFTRHIMRRMASNGRM